MKKFFTIIIPLAVAAVLGFQFTACEKYVLPELNISPDTLRFGAAGDSLISVVNSNVIWTAKPEEKYIDWLEAVPDYWEGPGELMIRTQDNDSVAPRSAVIIVKSESITKKLVIEQAGRPEESPRDL